MKMDVCFLKYEVWNVQSPEMGAVNAMVAGGYAPLPAMVLAARGLRSPAEAARYLSCDVAPIDPFAMTDMDLAVGRVRLALARGEKIAVFGDYDVDGITATCLLTHYLRAQGATCVSYIPGRLEEGYGLNSIALHQLADEHVSLIVTVDCGITAIEEASLCRALGIDLIITDHHECKQLLPDAVAVINPHRPDGGYPHKNLSGVGVAFKLAAALEGDQEAVLRAYADMVCLGTIADVMPLLGENRMFVARGLDMLKRTPRPGIAALMAECGCAPEDVTASSIGFMLAPRINAAGRIGQTELAIRLFLTQDEDEAKQMAQQLCELNRHRQAVESEIFQQAVDQLPLTELPPAIVLADERWHQGVVGIVASRIAEAYNCPTFLICLDGDHGKASSRSYGGFNLFSALSSLSDLLESYGGHELAAGFTIDRNRIDDFRAAICAMADEYRDAYSPRTTLEIDCAVTPELLTQRGIDALSALEPCGNGCPKPVLVLENLTVERISLVGNGRHLRLKLRQGYHSLNAIGFGMTAQSASIEPGDLVDVAFIPQINVYRGERTVQLNIQDIRPSCACPCSCQDERYRKLCNDTLDAADAAALLPERAELAAVWRYLTACAEKPVCETPDCLCRKIVRKANIPFRVEKLLVCLDIFSDVQLLQYRRVGKQLHITPSADARKADLLTSTTMQTLLRRKEGDNDYGNL